MKTSADRFPGPTILAVAVAWTGGGERARPSCVSTACARTGDCPPPSRVVLVAAGLAVALLALVVLTGCGDNGAGGSGGDSSLATLRADPLATAPITGAQLAGERATGGGSSLGKPVYARIQRAFRADRGPVDQALLDVAARAARDAGWSMTALSNGHYRGDKTTGGVRAVCNIYTDDSSRPPTLVVQITSRD